MNLENLCKHCFSPLSSPSGQCPNCQGDTGEERPLSYLPLETILNGKYIVGKVLGQGGFGITYLAYDMNLEMLVAIKEYFPTGMLTRSNDGFYVMPIANKRALFEQGLNQFLTEARILAQFKNMPNIVGVLNSFREYGTAYYVMDYIEGDSIKDIVSQNGPYRYENAIKLLLPVMDAIGKIHARGIFHRDISPDNIFITHDGTAKLLDFGAALISTDGISAKKETVLKPGYAPIEQYRKNEAQGAWTDVYAMAATLYYIITARKPMDSIDRASKDELIYPSQVGAASPAALDVVLKKALSIEASGRYQSMEEFSGALQAVLDGDIKTLTKTIKEKKKFPLIPIAIAGITVVAAAVAAIVLFAGGENAQDKAGIPAAANIYENSSGGLTNDLTPTNSLEPEGAFDLKVTLQKETAYCSDELYDSEFGDCECVSIIPTFETSNVDLAKILQNEIISCIDTPPSMPLDGVIMLSMDSNFIQAIHFFDGGGTSRIDNESICIDVKNLKRIDWTDLFEPSDLNKVKIKMNKVIADMMGKIIGNEINETDEYSTTNIDYFSGGLLAFIIDSEGITFIDDGETLWYESHVSAGTNMIKFPWDFLGVDITYPKDKLPQRTELNFNIGNNEPSIKEYTFGDGYAAYIASIPEAKPSTPTSMYEPETTPTDANEAYYQSIDDFIFEGKYRYYTYSELADKNQWELTIIRNGMFALSGKIFKSNKWCMEYFPKRSWYKPISSNVRDFMNDYQKKNANLIAEVEKNKGWR